MKEIKVMKIKKPGNQTPSICGPIWGSFNATIYSTGRIIWWFLSHIWNNCIKYNWTTKKIEKI